MNVRNKDLDALFERDPEGPVYSSIEDEIAAVASRDKGIVAHVLDPKQLDEIESFLRLAQQSGLETASFTMSDGVLPEQRLFAFHPDQRWRVDACQWAHSALFRYGCSDGLEALTSRILGYTDQQTSDWIERHRASYVGWAGITYYLLISREQLRALADNYFRIIPASDDPPPVCFRNMSRRSVFRPDAESRVGDSIIARASFDSALRSEFRSAYTDRGDSDVLSVPCTIEMIARMNKMMTSSVEIRTEGRWAGIESYREGLLDDLLRR